jgi:hypothetical protein
MLVGFTEQGELDCVDAGGATTTTTTVPPPDSDGDGNPDPTDPCPQQPDPCTVSVTVTGIVSGVVPPMTPIELTALVVAVNTVGDLWIRDPNVPPGPFTGLRIPYGPGVDGVTRGDLVHMAGYFEPRPDPTPNDPYFHLGFILAIASGVVTPPAVVSASELLANPTGFADTLVQVPLVVTDPAFGASWQTSDNVFVEPMYVGFLPDVAAGAPVTVTGILSVAEDGLLALLPRDLNDIVPT